MRYVILTILLIGCSTPPKIQYDGDLNDDGKWHGNGILTYSSGDYWEGEFKDGLPFNGEGMYIYPDKSKYVGRIIKGLKQGHGNQVWSPHDKYDGEFKDDKFSGKGTLIQFGGYKWVGEFENGLPLRLSK